MASTNITNSVDYVDMSLPTGPQVDADDPTLYVSDLAELPFALVRAKTKKPLTIGPQPSADTKRMKYRVLPWNEVDDPVSLLGPPALPMPVQISTMDTLDPFFQHLKNNTPFVETSGVEPNYDVPLVEYPKGVQYADGRMDLCKMVVGPTHISSLMDALDVNSHIIHFLLGNNIIGPAGARRIARFIHEHPDQMETWYLAGNCIRGEDFALIANELVKSNVVHNLWLKRNPLGPNAAPDIVNLILRARNLRTLDLDQTELGDAGVESVFKALNTSTPPTPLALRTLFLNGNGIGAKACSAIGEYLANPHCTIENLFMSCNPVGDAGCESLSKGIAQNQGLLRLSMQSCGLKTKAVEGLLKACTAHPRLQTLDLGQGMATFDLGQRFNYLDDALLEDVLLLIKNSSTLRYLNLGITPMSWDAIERIQADVMVSRLFYFNVNSIHPRDTLTRSHLEERVKARLTENVQSFYGCKSYAEFMEGPLRFLRNTKDVRYIDSVYRNRDMQAARRGLMELKKWWDPNDDTLDKVVAVEG